MSLRLVVHAALFLYSFCLIYADPKDTKCEQALVMLILKRCSFFL